MKKEMKNITSTKIADTNNVIIGRKNQERLIHLPFNKKDKYFSNPNNFVRFIKDIERLIRGSKEYSYYIHYLKNKVGLNKCTLFPNITDEEATIEMHHGPVFTLYDITEIVISDLFKKGKGINSSNVAYHVLKDHYENIILVTMLSKMAHIAVHQQEKNKNKDYKYFLNGEGSYGNFNAFIEKYISVMSLDHINKIRKYIKDYDEYLKSGVSEMHTFSPKITVWANKFSGTTGEEAA